MRELRWLLSTVALVAWSLPSAALADPPSPRPYFQAGAALNAPFGGLASGIRGGASLGAGAMWRNWAVGFVATDSLFVPEKADYVLPCVDAPCFQPNWRGHQVSFDLQARWFPWIDGPAVPFIQAAAGWSALLLADHATGQPSLSAEGIHLEADLGVALPLGDHLAAFALLGDSFTAVGLPQSFDENRSSQARFELGLLLHL